MVAADHQISPADEDRIDFGPFRLVPGRRRLTRDGIPVQMGHRVFEILLVLIRHAPEVVSKAALFEQVWPGSLIEESTLRFHLWTLRKALGDDGEDGSRYIATASGRGYRFVASLSRPAHQVIAAPATAAVLPATNLPVRLTGIVGRAQELAELEDWLADSRLVTLAGPGGVGKTRLAIELGWRLAAAFPAGTWLVDLAPLTDGETVASAVATVLGISVAKPHAAADAIVGALGKRRPLLILDNCEHLAEATAALAKTLLERAPGVTILATSQKSFQLAAERVYGLDPLDVPPAGTIEIGGFAAVELFAQRGRAADRAFALSPDNADAVGEICRQLDGLPLALEMAAGRLRLLGVEGLRQGLDDRLKLLKGSADGGVRHGSLHGMLDWSHSLLAPFDQTVFRRLSAFPGSFSLDAAVAVAGGDEAERWDIVDALGRLIDSSLVTIERSEPARYRLLETVRIYATNRLLECGETDAIVERHVRHFIEVFEEARRRWEEIPDPDWIARYRADLENFRAGLDWALATPERRQLAIALGASGLNLLSALWLEGEARAYVDRIIALFDAETPPVVAARLLSYAASYYQVFRDQNGLVLAERSIALHRKLADRRDLANALITTAHYRMWQGQLVEANEHLAEARQLIAGGGFKKSENRLALLTGLAAYHAKDFTNARRYLLEAVALAQSIRSGSDVAALFNLALIEYIAGNIDRAIEISRDALDRTKSRLGHAYTNLILTNLAAYLIAKGEFAEGRVRLTEAFTGLTEGGKAQTDLQLWAVLSGMEGRLAEAARMIGASEAARVRAGQILQPAARILYDRLMGLLNAGLPPAEIEALTAEGARWSGAEALDFIVNRLMHPPAAGSSID